MGYDLNFAKWFHMNENYYAKTALIVTDVQNDFVEGGSLAVEHGREVVGPINLLADQVRSGGGVVVYSDDLHPPDHSSFESQGGQWPTHCVIGTFGQEFVPDLKVNGPIFDKATEKDVDSYSSFGGRLRGSQKKVTLDEYLRENGITHNIIAGLALDVCVAETAIESVKLGYHTSVYLPGSRAVSSANVRNTVERLKHLGVFIIE